MAHDGMDLLDAALRQYHADLALARSSGVEAPNTASLATADASGRPSVRTITLEAAERDGFVFFANRHSGKALQLAANPRAALCVHWAALHRQVIVEGDVVLLADEEADAYWRKRHRDSQFGAWASEQSRPASERGALKRRLSEVREQFGYEAVTRPEAWLAYRLVPDRIEFWQSGWHRLRERVRYLRSAEGWTRDHVNP